MKQSAITSALDASATRRQPPPAAPREKIEAKPKKATIPTGAKGARIGKMQIAGFFSPEVGRTLKLIAVEQSSTAQALIEEGLRAVFKKYGKEWKE
jgi:hypothetical protein